MYEWFLIFVVANWSCNPPAPIEHPTIKEYVYHDVHSKDGGLCQLEANRRNASEHKSASVYWFCELRPLPYGEVK